MTIKDGFKRAGEYIVDKYYRAEAHVKHPTLLAARGLEKVVDVLTPVAAVLTVGADPSGNVVERAVQGPYHVAKILYHTIAAYATNMGIRDFTNSAAGNAADLAINAGKNIFERPIETGVIMGLTFLLGTATSKAIGLWNNYRTTNYVQNR